MKTLLEHMLATAPTANTTDKAVADVINSFMDFVASTPPPATFMDDKFALTIWTVAILRYHKDEEEHAELVEAAISTLSSVCCNTLALINPLEGDD